MENSPYTEDSLMRKGEIEFYAILARTQARQRERVEAQERHIENMKNRS